MAGGEKDVEGTSSRGNDWEVVSLTASAYAAAPGPIYLPDDESKDEDMNVDVRETSAAMFMSQHFVLLPSEHENLPIESEYGEIHNESAGENAKFDGEDSDAFNKTQGENWKTKSDDSLHGIEFFHKEKSLSIHAMEFGDGKALQGLSLIGEEHVRYDSRGFNALAAETGEKINAAELIDPSYENVGSPSDVGNDSKPNEDKCVRFGLPCEAWWKRQAAYLYNHAKEANTFWSILAAAALMGFVILGQQWQREKYQLQQLRWEFSISEQRMNWILGPITRFKDVLVGGQQRTPLIRGAIMSSH